MKSWQLNNRISEISGKLEDSVETETWIDFRCLSEPEKELFEEIREITDKYSPAVPPPDVIQKNSKLWYKGLEIFGRRATELFVEILPETFLCDELERRYFKLYFYNFMLDWQEAMQKVREMPEEKRLTLIAERRQMDLLDFVFRLPRTPLKTKQEEAVNNEA